MDIKITWVYPNEIVNIWEIILPGLNKAIKNSDNLMDSDYIKYCLESGQWSLYVLTDEEINYLGFAIVERLNTARGEWLNIPFAYSDDPKVELHKEFLGFLEEKARKRKCAGVTFISQRKGYKKKAKDLGYEVQFIKYKKEL